MPKLKFAVDYVTPGGATYKGGSVHEVNADTARVLLYKGIAQEAPRAAAATKTTDKGA